MIRKRFYNWTRDESTAERVLYIGGEIASQQWFDGDVTPELFRSELYSDSGPITVYVNSMGGDCTAASRIYTMMIEYPWDVTVKIDGLAASAASVIAMAGTKVLIAPTAGILIHDPETLAIGNADEMRRTVQTLNEVKESIINAYQLRTGLSRTVLWNMMARAEYMNAYRALELRFADGLITDTKRVVFDSAPQSFSMRALIGVGRNTAAQTPMPPDKPSEPEPTLTKPTGIPLESLKERLFSIAH
ncbi:MAG: Clp protease ClpP [Oscillospiraceae bacterium]|jgi:ATP-dependent Clp protease protease subunit|nr:Clp protease ClpP [Oscillospiraceae bacterium]